jgi:hypothetical protein
MSGYDSNLTDTTALRAAAERLSGSDALVSAAAALIASNVVDGRGEQFVQLATVELITPALGKVLRCSLRSLGTMRRFATLIEISQLLVPALLKVLGATPSSARDEEIGLLATVLLGHQHSPALCAVATPGLMRAIELQLAPGRSDSSARRLHSVAQGYVYLHRACDAATRPLVPLIAALGASLATAAFAPKSALVELLRAHAWVRDRDATSGVVEETRDAAESSDCSIGEDEDALPWFEGLWTTTGPRSEFELALRARRPCRGVVVASPPATPRTHLIAHALVGRSSSALPARGVGGDARESSPWLQGHLQCAALSDASDADALASELATIAGWECAHCTMRNAESRTTCEACSKARPTLDVAEPRSAWVPFRARFGGARGDGAVDQVSFLLPLHFTRILLTV